MGEFFWSSIAKGRIKVSKGGGGAGAGGNRRRMFTSH